ncbi:DUF3987 domain-containing protein [Xanthomonas campestris pv. raphani]|uniref:DUF3987 domain-containing protein n=1 Tax=Xanthomonas campestris pv. juglandis TaxID=195709 RepID=A0A8E4ELL7_XANCJ|nr:MULTISPECIES: DUF3987 domain-containing protein [Xanthomonas]KOB02330.1 hypothetical protein AE920_03560 [Xanthomonas arboricola]KOB14618.1 hypothetical protein AE924_13535 [Xanthomonas arboricola]KOB37528.1 hypothetical protein AE929_02295 [Xanthomonas arboricola]MCC8554975.1 DUF3987 domain-containing protein [Xanthomonas hortorum pv. gardneri]MCE4299911.1 DUF3987 domain-containing protein [Xanthomonas hortorum pv. vitians]
MNAVVIETPKDAARRVAASCIRDGFKPEALHEYRDAQGNPVFWRIRCKRPSDGDKWIRPMRWDGAVYVIGEPPAPDAGKPLYRLPELLATNPDAVVWIVEGEACADALAKLDLTATTSGSADSADAADWTPLQGRRMRIWPDHDKAGAGYADKVESRLRALGCAVERVDVDTLDLPAKGDCVDWLKSHPDADAVDVLSLPLAEEMPAESPAGRSAPEPLRRPTPPPEPYPLESLGEVLRPAAEAIKRVIQAPDAIIGGSLLAAASLAVQGQADVQIDGRIHPLSLWLLSVAQSGERKSAVDAEAMRAARVFEAELTQGYELESTLHEQDMAQWQARVDAAKSDAKKKKGEGLKAALHAIGPPPPAPLLPRVTVADFTAEGIFKLMQVSRPALGAFTDEAALVFGGHGMSKETVMRTAGTLCKLWDRGELDRVRAGDGAMKLQGRRFALHLLAQPVIAERALSDDVLAGQGFLARCLLAWPEGTAGWRTLSDENLRDDVAMQRMVDVLLSRFRQELPLAEGKRQELEPRALRLSTEARAVWADVYSATEQGMRQGGRFAQVQAWASKTPEQAARIAGVLTLIDDPAAQVISADAMDRAAELALWHLNEAVRLAGTAELSPDVRDAEALLGWCHESGREVIYSRLVMNKGPNRTREREAFQRAVRELEHAGWALPVNGGMTLDGGHRRHVWRIVPYSEGQ